jgi:cell division septation protein DedD
MGRNQFGAPVHAEDSRVRDTPQPSAVAKTKQAVSAPSPGSGEWDFYGKSAPKDPVKDVAKGAQPNGAPAASSRAADSSGVTTKPVVATKPPAPFQPPKLGKGAIVLQVSALTRQGDALAMADAIQQKKFPSFVVTPTTDNFYRVQVGPYADEKSAEAAKHALEQAGFKSIIKR